MEYKFEKLEVWKLAIRLSGIAYEIANQLPDSERFNLNSQLKRSVTSTALNIAEGSTTQTNAEQARFLSFAIRSHIESIACLRLIESRNYLKPDNELAGDFEKVGSLLFGKLQAFKKALA